MSMHRCESLEHSVAFVFPLNIYLFDQELIKIPLVWVGS